ncbi:MAG: FGGY-family carbohydrate kinase [Litoreibacter sp.]
MNPRHVAVIDIGKTNAKLACIDTSNLTEIAVVTTPNIVLEGPPYPHFDVETIWTFLLGALATFHTEHHIDAISITTHGAACALIAGDGTLASPILDYEHTGPDDAAGDYDNLRPAFAETGSPRLPMGLNLGAQIHWQFLGDPTLRNRTRSIVTYPQYWGHRLTGVLASDVTSLGCHTDLWNPFEARFSTLVDRLKITDKMAPPCKSSVVLGHISKNIATRTGLLPETPVFCGIHDSNASLLPHVMHRRPPFSVVSTGTWVIAMAIGGMSTTLDPLRDTVVNVNALGEAVPSARFMGGREYELLQGSAPINRTEETLVSVAGHGPMLMPSVVPESGPFQGQKFAWVGKEPKQGTSERAAAVSFYLAMVTAQCLSLIAHKGPIIVEGPFASNVDYCGMLCAATRSMVVTTDSTTGTSQGAAMLALDLVAETSTNTMREFTPDDYPTYAKYAQLWRTALCDTQGFPSGSVAKISPN